MRVARLLLAESIVLAVASGGAALLCGYWTSDALRRLVFPDSRWTCFPGAASFPGPCGVTGEPRERTAMTLLAPASYGSARSFFFSRS